MSRDWGVLGGDLDDFDEWLEYLLSMRKIYDAACKEIGISPISTDERSLDESLTFLISRNRIWKRWVANYNERTKIRISLLFNLASQNDNRTNLKIAGLTSDMALETKRDSSAMKT
jgi:hypothetical protein